MKGGAGLLEFNSVYQGDCLEVMKGKPDKSVDMVLTSPPYDNLRDYKGYTFNFEGIAQEIYRVLKDGGVCVCLKDVPVSLPFIVYQSRYPNPYTTLF